MYRENVRHPTSPTQWIIPYFKFNSNVVFGEKIRYLAFVFEKYFVQTIYIYTYEYLFIYKVACGYLFQRIIY